jgi:hypothetical protein
MKLLILAALSPLIIFSLDNVYADAELTDLKSIFELLVSSPDELLTELDIPQDSSGIELEEELTTTPHSCKNGLNPVIKASSNSPACVKPTSIYKLIERNWMKIREAFAQPMEDSMPTSPTQDKDDRAMFYSVRASGGMLEHEIKANFHKFTPYTSQEPRITPDNPVDLKTTKFKFAVESLPSKDKLDYYRLVGRVMAQDPNAREPFDVNIDVISGDGTILQTWAYTNCQIQNFVTYLQDTVFFHQFSGEPTSEIRDRFLLQCSSLELEVP